MSKVRRRGIDMSTFVFVLVLLLLFPLLCPVRKFVRFHAVLEHWDHTEVFEYLSDVGAFQALNPTMVDGVEMSLEAAVTGSLLVTRIDLSRINITLWERTNQTNFYVEYSECLSQVPVVSNNARAHYEIQHGGDGSHRLVSSHSTCFFADFLCLPTDSVVYVTKLSPSKVGYREDIRYFCPWPLSSFCFNEVTFQRKRIISKLEQLFTRKENIHNHPPEISDKN